MNKIFYVYIYLDPRKPGKYKYEKYKFNYEPIYVGKGKDSRIFDFKRRNVLLKRKLNKCFEPVYLIFKDNMTEDKAFIEEKKLIATIGRLDLKRGPLCNLIDGGEGVSGIIWTEDHRRNLGKTNKGDRFDKYKKEKGSWNKGLTKENSDGVRRIAESRTGKERKDLTKRNLESNPMDCIESRKKASASLRGISLENWDRFISKEPYTEMWTDKFKRLIRKRDNRICMLCGIHSERLTRALSVHHINYDKTLTIPQNCISLCLNCHVKTNTNRKYWTTFFQSLLSERYGYQYSENKEAILTLNNEKIKI